MDDRLKPCPFCGNKEPESYLAHPQYRGKKDESIDLRVAEIRNAIDAYDSFFQTGRTTL